MTKSIATLEPTTGLVVLTLPDGHQVKFARGDAIDLLRALIECERDRYLLDSLTSPSGREVPRNPTPLPYPLPMYPGDPIIPPWESPPVYDPRIRVVTRPNTAGFVSPGVPVLTDNTEASGAASVNTD